MFKGLGILVGGIFIGAVGAEVVRKACPGGFDKLYASVGQLANAAREAFVEGYQDATGGSDAEPAGA